MTTCSCKILSSWDEIEPLRTAWRDLHRRCGQGLFVGYDWLRPWWDLLGCKKNILLQLVTAQQEGRLVGTLALGIRRCGGLRILEWAGTELYDYCDVLAETPEVAQALWTCARRCAKYDLASIRDVRVDSRSFSCLTAFAVRSSSRKTLRINMKQDKPVEWQNVLPGKQRRNFARQRRRLEQVGPVRFEVSMPDQVPVCAMGSLIEQKRAWCQRKNEWGVFTPANIQNIFCGMAELAAGQSQLFLGTLTCAEAPIAHTLAFLDRGTLYAYAKTYDEKWGDYSPGLQALVESIRWAVDHDVYDYDFMRGDEDYKLRFSNDTLELGSFLFAHSLLGWVCIQGLLLFRWLRGRLNRASVFVTAFIRSGKAVPAFLKKEREQDKDSAAT